MGKRFLSEAIVGHSDDDDGRAQVSNSPSKKQRSNGPSAPKQTKKTAPPQPQVSSDPDSAVEDEESDTDGGTTVGIGQANKVNGFDTRANETSTDEDSSSADESASGSEEESSVEAEAGPAKSKNSHATKFRPAPPFKPPPGFEAVALHASPTVSRASKIMQASELQGKQIWHITAPSDVPISTIKEVSLGAVKNGESVIEHKGIDYGFLPKGRAETPTGLLIQTAKGYQPASAEITETLHLQQLIRPPNLSKRAVDPSRKAEAAPMCTMLPIKAPRPQPKGLKMRYRPSGFGGRDPGTLGSSDSDEPQPSFRQPPVVNLVDRPEKRKHTEDVEEDGVARKAAKKARKEEKRRRSEAPGSGRPNGTSAKSPETVKVLSEKAQATPPDKSSTASPGNVKADGESNGQQSTKHGMASSPTKTRNAGSWSWPKDVAERKDEKKKKRRKKRDKESIMT